MIKKEYKQWNNGDIVLIGTGTGSGKSYFIRNQLSDYAEEQGEEILFIFNRKKLHEQNKAQIHKVNNIRIHTATYQEIEHSIIHNDSYDFSKYKYIVCDECHYFTDDSGFNHNSDISFNSIMSQSDKVKIFMSATSCSLFSFIKENQPKHKIWDYKQKKSYKHINSLYFYREVEAVQRFIDKRFNGDEKIIWFCKSVKKAVQLHSMYPDSYFLCSESEKNKRYLKLLDENTFAEQGDKITFNRKFLFTTKVLDNGFDLKDERIKLIICDEFDINTMIQCLGRKRILSDTDKVNVILFNHSNNSLNGIRSLLNNKLNEVEAFKEGGVEGRNNYVGRFAHRSNYIIYDQPSPDNKYSSNKRISLVKYLKAKNDFSVIDEMIERNKALNKMRIDLKEKKRSDAYMLCILELMDLDRCGDLDKMFHEKELTEYLDFLLGKQLFKQEQKELIERMNVRSNGKQLKSYEALNIALTELKLDYRIISEANYKRNLEDGSPNLARKKKYWRVMRLTDSK